VAGVRGSERSIHDPSLDVPMRDRSLDAPLPLTKRELKEQRRRQKQEEKAAAGIPG
jgi:hypothetical protein